MDTRYDIIRRHSVGSTQDVAAAAFDRSGQTTLVVAEQQLAGRGRSNSPWWQADRALYSSLALNPPWPAPRWGLLPLLTAVALHDAIALQFGVTTRCRWPNDLLTDAGKVSGILVEASSDRAVIGCGVNLFWLTPAEGAAAVAAADPGAEAAERLAVAWVDAVLGWLDAGPEAWPAARYRSLSATIGATVSWAAGSGIAVGIAADGGLEVDTGVTTVVLHSADVRLGTGSVPPTSSEQS